jgi:hypothetical protein
MSLSSFQKNPVAAAEYEARRSILDESIVFSEKSSSDGGV